MKCPTCKESTLVIAERAGIEIDHCPECRGVWLDRGELDKIVERARGDNRDSRESDKYRDEYRHDHRYKKKKSFFEELFD